MDIQRLRNLTTRRLHTKMSDIYKDVEELVGEAGVMTHSLPRAVDAMTPYLKSVAKDARFWDGKYDPSHVGEIDVTPMNEEQKRVFWQLFAEA